MQQGNEQEEKPGKSWRQPWGEQGQRGTIPGEPKAERLRREAGAAKETRNLVREEVGGLFRETRQVLRKQKGSGWKGEMTGWRCLESRDGKKGEWRRARWWHGAGSYMHRPRVAGKGGAGASLTRSCSQEGSRGIASPMGIHLPAVPPGMGGTVQFGEASKTFIQIVHI